MDDDILDINAEDLEEPEPPPPSPAEGELPPAGEAPLPPVPVEADLLVIEADDLTLPPLAAPRPGPGFPPMRPPGVPWGPPPGPVYPPAVGSEWKSRPEPYPGSLALAHATRGGPLLLALAGAIGGFLAWLIMEPFITDRQGAQSLVTTLLSMGGFGALLGGLIGAALGGAEGLSEGVPARALRGMGWGLLIGGAGGILGGILGQLLFGSLVHGEQTGLGILVLVRTIAWALVGVGIGLGQGMHRPSPRKLTNGLLGGAIGGAFGGLLFDPIGLLLGLLAGFTGMEPGLLSRMVGMTLMGLFVGAAIGLVEELRKEAWVLIVQGPLAGKQFILYRPVTTIGSSPQADICLIKDRAVRPEHAVLQQSGEGHTVLAAPEGPVAVNGASVTRQRLQAGDELQVGETVLQYQVRAQQAAVAGYGPPGY